MAKKRKGSSRQSSYDAYYEQENKKEAGRERIQFHSYEDDFFRDPPSSSQQRSKRPVKRKKKRKYQLVHPEKLIFAVGFLAVIIILLIVLMRSMRKPGTEGTSESTASVEQVIKNNTTENETGTVRSVNRTDLSGIPKQLASYMVSMVHTNPDNYKKEPGSLYGQTVLENSEDLSEYRFIIAIDAGHGGTDIGWQVGEAVEKEITLAMAEKLVEYINAHTQEFYAILLRSNDVVMTDQQRVNRAIENHAGLIVSLHCNGSEEELGGTSAVYWTGEGDENERAVYSQELANQLMTAAADGFGMWEREVRTEDNPLLHTTIPSVMVEMGYLTYELDHEWIMQEELQAAAAEKMGDAIIEFVKEIAPKSDDSGNSSDSQSSEASGDSGESSQN